MFNMGNPALPHYSTPSKGSSIIDLDTPYLNDSGPQYKGMHASLLQHAHSPWMLTGRLNPGSSQTPPLTRRGRSTLANPVLSKSVLSRESCRVTLVRSVAPELA
jgi:hypothetical protein